MTDSAACAGVPLGSGSFESLLRKPGGGVQLNTPELTHWALHAALRDADLIADWWPDEWRHPVGYHVTAGCSRPGDAHWKTFDASWRWDATTLARLEQIGNGCHGHAGEIGNGLGVLKSGPAAANDADA
jgi:hypothetical protein